MTDLIILLLGTRTEEPLLWARCIDGAVAEHGVLENASALLQISGLASTIGHVVAILPGEQVATRFLPGAPRSAAKRQAAASFLIEDELGEPSAMLAIATGDHEGAGALAIAVRKEILSQWLGVFAVADIHCDVITSDFLAVRPEAGKALLLARGEKVVVSTSVGGCAVENGLLTSVLPQFLGAATHIEDFGVNLPPNMFPDGVEIIATRALDDAEYFGLVARLIQTKPPPSFVERRLLKRGAFVAAIAPWRRVGALAAALGVAISVGVVVDGALALRETAHWKRGALDLHRQSHPEALNEDPAAYARRVLAQGGTQAALLSMSQKIADAVRQNEAVEIDRVRFDATRSEYAVSLRSTTDSAIESFKTSLQAKDLAISDSGGYRRTGEYWTGDIMASAK